MTSIKRVLVLPDMQVPYHDEKTMNAVEQFMADYTWDEYINLGDFMDFDCISHHNKGKPKNLENKRLEKDYDVANEILDRHQRLIRKRNPKAKFVLLEGNHEYRAERLIEEIPQLDGLINVEKNLRLQERGFKYVKCYSDGEDYVIGNAHFHHGLYTNDLHAKKHVAAWGSNIFYGHLHDIQGYSMVLKGEDKTIVGQSMGCLCRYDQQYMKGRPSRWQQAIGVFEFLPDGMFSYYVLRIFKHRFSFNGKIYAGV